MNVCPDPDYRIEAQDHIVIVSGSDEIGQLDFIE